MNIKLKITGILSLVMLIVCLFSGTVVAETWESESLIKILNLTYGEEITTVDLMGNVVSGCNNAEHINFNISNMASTSIVMSNNGSIINVNTSKIGSQNIVVGTQKNSDSCTESWEGEPYYTSITVNCSYSTQIQNMIESLGGTMDESTYSTANMFGIVSDDNMDSIINSETIFSSLNAKEKELVDTLVQEKGVYTNYSNLLSVAKDRVQSKAQEFVDRFELEDIVSEDLTESKCREIVGVSAEAFDLLSDKTKSATTPIIGISFLVLESQSQDIINEIEADKFIEENQLSAEPTREVLENMLTLKDEFESLSLEIQTIVLENLDLARFDDLINAAQEMLDIIDAEDFIDDNKLEEELTKEIAENIVELEDDFEEFRPQTQEIILDMLEVTDFSEIIENAQEFLDSLPQEELPVTSIEKNDLENDETELNNISEDNQKSWKNPKTGDYFFVMYFIMGISLIGLVITIIKKRNI